jgi:hypothetical protein
MSKKVRVLTIDTGECLFETTIDQIEKAYEYAAQLDEMGIEVKISAPTIADTLSDSLGLKVDDQEKLHQSIIEEMEDHDGSCCATPYEFSEKKLQ